MVGCGLYTAGLIHRGLKHERISVVVFLEGLYTVGFIYDGAYTQNFTVCKQKQRPFVLAIPGEALNWLTWGLTTYEKWKYQKTGPQWL